MQRFFDPMAYRFYFICATEDSNDSTLMDEMRLILEETEPYILAFAESESWSVSCEYHLEKALDRNHAPEIMEHALFPLSRDYLETWKNYLKTVASYDFCKIDISHLHQMKCDKWYTGPSKNQKQLNRIPKLISSLGQSEDICPDREKELQDLLYEYLNCPNDSLTDISYPSGKLACCPFKVQYYAQAPNDRFFRNITGNCGLDKTLNRHIIDVQIPRFMFENGFPFQDLWTARLKKLGSRYERCYGSVSLDAFVMGTQMTPFEFQHKNCYFAEHIPGYAWANCYCPSHVKLLGDEITEQSKAVFNKSELLKNGGIFLQMTEDIDHLSREANNRCAQLPAPFMSDKEYLCDYELPFSYRTSLQKGAIRILHYPYTGYDIDFTKTDNR